MIALGRFATAGSTEVDWIRPVDGTLGVLSGTLVETSRGWRRVEYLDRFSKLYTYDGELRQIVGLQRGSLGNDGSMVVCVPGGKLNVCQDLLLLPDQPILVGSRGGQDGRGKLCLAKHLCGRWGVRAARLPRGTTVFQLAFEEEELIYANTGALIYCPATKMPKRSFFESW
ncbi:MAG: Hint domain-containing protein, partial [Pseudomonadota bacterium]